MSKRQRLWRRASHCTRRAAIGWGLADALGSLGRIALLRVDLDEAQQKLQQAMTVSSGVGDLQGLSEWRYLLGRVSLYRGDADEARRLLAESLNLCIDQQKDVRVARVCTCLAETALWEGKLDEAEHWLSQSLAYHSEPQRITIYTVERLFVAARLATAQQQYPRAATLFGLADQVHGQVHYAIGGPMRALADAALATVRVRWTRRFLPRACSRLGGRCRLRGHLPRFWRRAMSAVCMGQC